MLWTLEQVAQSSHWACKDPLPGLPSRTVSSIYDLEGSLEAQGRADGNLFCHEQKMELGDFWLFPLCPRALHSPFELLPWSSGRQAGSVQGRKAVLQSGPMLAEPFPGMLAPSAQAENFASANCDFRTQVCSWTWMPSCQCVAICHQHMAP